jgi:hypothetical protein
MYAHVQIQYTLHASLYIHYREEGSTEDEELENDTYEDEDDPLTEEEEEEEEEEKKEEKEEEAGPPPSFLSSIFAWLLSLFGYCNKK